MLVSCTLTVVEESPKTTAIEMIQDCQQEALIKLKGCRKLRGDLTSYNSKMALVISDQKTLFSFVEGSNCAKSLIG